MIGCAPFPPSQFVSAQFLGAANSGASGVSTHTLSGLSFGAASDDRYIIVGVGWSGAQSLAIGTTIGGIAPLLRAQPVPVLNTTAFAIANVPTGTTGTVFLNFTGAVVNVAIVLWAMVGVQSTTPHAEGSSLAVAAPAATLAVPAGGYAFGVSHSTYSSVVPATWTGLVEDYDAAVGSQTTLTGAGLASSDGDAGLFMRAAYANASNSSGSFITYGP